MGWWVFECWNYDELQNMVFTPMLYVLCFWRVFVHDLSWFSHSWCVWVQRDIQKNLIKRHFFGAPRKWETLMGMCRPFFRPTLVASWIASQRGGANIDGAVPAEAMKPVEASPKDSCTPGTFDRVLISCKLFHGFGGFNTPRIVLIHPKRQWREYLNPDHTGLYARCAWEYRLESIYAQVWFSSGWYNYP